jgi:hypothetical protein
MSVKVISQPVKTAVKGEIAEKKSEDNSCTVPPTKKPKTDADTDFNGQLFPLSEIVHKYSLFKEILSRKSWGKDEGPITGTQQSDVVFSCVFFFEVLVFFVSLIFFFFFLACDVTLDALLKLWNMANPEWRLIRERFEVGLIKESNENGNTSVSMGTAYKLKKPAQTAIGFLNCGTGGIKYQMYAMNVNGLLTLVDEFKPKNSFGFSDVPFGTYTPTKDPKTSFGLRTLMKTELKQAPWAGKKDVIVYGFVTGTIRQHWEKEQNSKQKFLMTSEVGNIFREFGILPVEPGGGDSFYFLTQEQEGTYEFEGITTLYDNLTKANLLSGNKRPVLGIGIGQGTSQIVIDALNDQVDLFARTKKLIFGYNAGMKDSAKLQLLPNAWKAALLPPKSIYLQRLIDLCKEDVNFTPVIALKSGCLISLEANPIQKKILCARIQVPVSNTVVGSESKQESAIRAYAVNPSDPKQYMCGLIITKPTSIPRLCISAQNRFGIENLHFAFDCVGELIRDVKLLFNDSHVYFSSSHEIINMYDIKVNPRLFDMTPWIDKEEEEEEEKKRNDSLSRQPNKTQKFHLNNKFTKVSTPFPLIVPQDRQSVVKLLAQAFENFWTTKGSIVSVIKPLAKEKVFSVTKQSTTEASVIVHLKTEEPVFTQVSTQMICETKSFIATTIPYTHKNYLVFALCTVKPNKVIPYTVYNDDGNEIEFTLDVSEAKTSQVWLQSLSTSITGPDKASTFFDEECDYTVQFQILPYNDDTVGASYFSVSQPGERRYKHLQPEKTNKNVAQILYAPDMQGHRNALLRITVRNSCLQTETNSSSSSSKSSTSQEPIVLFQRDLLLYGKLIWMTKISSTEPAAKKMYTSFPLCYIPDKWMLAVKDLIFPNPGPCIGDNVESINALHSVLIALGDIYGYGLASETCADLCKEIQVGMFKETQDCGNSSVSMGFAKVFFDKKENQKRNFVAFLNCGTGGTKYQLYYRNPVTNAPTTIAEAKPGKCALSQLDPCGTYKPEDTLPRQTLDEIRAEYLTGLQKAPWKQLVSDDSSLPDISELLDPNFKPFAFITGSIRNWWEPKKREERYEMDEVIKDLFGDHVIPVTDLLGKNSSGKLSSPKMISSDDDIGSSYIDMDEDGEKHESYFLCQNQEGRMEALGVYAMYKAIFAKQQRKLVPVVIIGIGSGSCQVTIIQLKLGGKVEDIETKTIAYTHGMREGTALRNLGQYIINHDFAPAMMDALKAVMQIEGCIPTIALKSGAAIRLWDKFVGDDIRRQLCEPPNNHETTVLLPSKVTVSYSTKKSLSRQVWEAYLDYRNTSKKANNGIAVNVQPLTCIFNDGSLIPNPHGLGELPAVLHFNHLPYSLDWWPTQYCLSFNDSTEKKSTSSSSSYDLSSDGVSKNYICDFDQLENGLHHRLNIQVPFDEIKNFWERRGNTIIKRFNRILTDFFSYDSKQKPSSYTCVIRVVRLMYDIWMLEQTNKDEYDNLKYMMHDDAANFASQAPQYNSELFRNICILPEKLELYCAKFQEEHVILGSKPYISPSWIQILWNIPKKARPVRQPDVDMTKCSLTESKELKHLFQTNIYIRASKLLVKTFGSNLEAICNSPLLKNTYRNVHCKFNTKTYESIKRKGSGGKNAEPNSILDYLRGTIYLGEYIGVDNASELFDPFMTQVIGILNLIEERKESRILRMKLEHVKKAFLILNISFSSNGINMVAEIQLRLPAKEHTSSPPDDHLKHEVVRTFGECINNPKWPLQEACKAFFNAPCNREFPIFHGSQFVTVSMSPSDNESVTISSIPQSTEEVDAIAALRTPGDFKSQWMNEIDRFRDKLMNTTDSSGSDKSRQGDLFIRSVWVPLYVPDNKKTEFSKGVRTGFKILLTLIQERYDLRDETEKTITSSKSTKEKDQQKTIFIDPKLINKRFAQLVANTRDHALYSEDKKMWDKAPLTNCDGHNIILQKEDWKLVDQWPDIQEFSVDQSSSIQFYCSQNSQYSNILGKTLGMTTSPFVQGIVTAMRFSCRNRLGHVLSDEHFTTDILQSYLIPQIMCHELKSVDNKMYNAILQNALIFEIIAAVYTIAEVTHSCWTEKNGNVDHLNIPKSYREILLTGENVDCLDKIQSKIKLLNEEWADAIQESKNKKD